MAFEETLVNRLEDVNFREDVRDKLYLGSYSVFLEFFHNRIAIASFEDNDAKAGVFLVYSWMAQAVLSIDSLGNFGSAKSALLKAQSSDISIDEFRSVRDFVGGSLIATSKYLHLMNPDRYAIWDRRVAWAGYRFQYPYQYNKEQRYAQYLSDLRELVLPTHLRKRISEFLPNATEMRAKEFALFHLGIAEQSE